MELVRAPKPWYEDRQRLADLADWLKEQGREPDDWAYYMRRAEKWTPHYEDMVAEEREAELSRLADEDEAHGRYGL
jgi:hypothetical protein